MIDKLRPGIIPADDRPTKNHPVEFDHVFLDRTSNKVSSKAMCDDRWSDASICVAFFQVFVTEPVHLSLARPWQNQLDGPKPPVVERYGDEPGLGEFGD